MPRTTFDRISRDSSIMAIGTALSRITGLARIFALAYALGITSLADAYNLANVTPLIVHDLVIGGVLSATFVPVFVEQFTKHNQKIASEAISSVVTLTVVILLIATGLFALAAPLFIDLYTLANHLPSAPTERQVAISLLVLFTPQLTFYGLMSILTALLNARKRFAAPMYAPIVTNLLTIGILLFYAKLARHSSLIYLQKNYGYILLLGIGSTLAVGAQILVTLPSLRGLNLNLHWHWQPRNPAVLTIIRLSGWTFGFVIANQLALFITLALADSLGAGTVASYNYAYTFFQLPFGIIAISIMTAMTPRLAEYWTKGNNRLFGHSTTLGLLSVLALAIPAMVGYLILAHPIVELILAHGATKSAQVDSTSAALKMLALGIPGFCAYLYLIRVYQSMQDTRTAFYIYLFENAMNILFLFLLYGPLGIKGIALSISIAYTLGTIVALLHLHYRIGNLYLLQAIKPLSHVIISSIIMGFIVALITSLITAQHGILLLLRVGLAILAGLASFALTALIAANVPYMLRHVVTLYKSTNTHRALHRKP